MAVEQDQSSPVRAWFRAKAKVITMYCGAISAVIAVIIGYNQLDWPRPAMHTEVREVQQYAAGTREIVLNQEWFRLEAELRRAEAEYARNPSPVLLDSISRLKSAIRSVQGQIDELKK
jgi:hypothetical protein